MKGDSFFPFAAVLGQERMKNAIIWNMVNPRIGGALLCGERGTAKSTLVRGAALLSDMPFVNIPLNVSDDKLTGSIDIETALRDGRRVFSPGLLHGADGGILYIDEVNLLADHIVNALLDAAASGVNRVEREGVSFEHQSRFILIGSMNEEEGALRPQFLDRFGLWVAAEGEKDPAARAGIMRSRVEFESSPEVFALHWTEETAALRGTIRDAQELLPRVRITENAMKLAATFAAQVRSAGHRGEMVLMQTAAAIAALDRRGSITLEDLKLAAEYALPHRARNGESAPAFFEEPPPEAGTDEQEPQKPPPETNEAPESEGNAVEKTDESGNDDTNGDAMGDDSQWQDWNEKVDNDTAEDDEDLDVQEAAELFAIKRWKEAPEKHGANAGSGRRKSAVSKNRQGRYIKWRVADSARGADLAFDATFRAAAPFQKTREEARQDAGLAVAVEKSDLRVKVREKKTGGHILFVVDASASMGANRRMKEVKAAILSMLGVSYQKRDQVALIAFRKTGAELLLGFTRSVELARKRLAELPTGGTTPLAAGLELAWKTLAGLRLKDRDARPTLVLVSDGRASAGLGQAPFQEALEAAERIGRRRISSVIIDTENGFLRFKLCEKLGEKMGGVVIGMEELRSQGIVEAVAAFGRR
jgi:magnesium chelatase subunit D